MAGPPLSADPGVAVKANAENATANAVAILPIVFITFSDKVEPPWGAPGIEFLFSPVASFVHLTIKSLLCCKQSSPAHDRLRAVLVYALAMSSLTDLRLRRTGREGKCMHA